MMQNESDNITKKTQRRGRKPIVIDLVDLGKLAALQCTDEDIAGWFNVSTRTIENRRKHAAFAAVMRHGRAKGRVSVRRNQMVLLEEGNVTMGIFLGKNILGQRDGVTPQPGGTAAGPIEPHVKPDFSRLTDTELLQLRELALKTRPEPAAASEFSSSATRTSKRNAK